MYEAMDVPLGQSGPNDPGLAMEEAILGDLQSRRPDLQIRRSQSALEFRQYRHLAVFPTFQKEHRDSHSLLNTLKKLTDALPPSDQASVIQAEIDRVLAHLSTADALVTAMKDQMPSESLLKLDLTVAEDDEQSSPLLRIALSAKWSLRTDRAQDCISQGSKLVGQRRGRMPHYAVITIEPRPSMLKIIGDGSGAVDCVYHLHLPALTQAVETAAQRSNNPATWPPAVTFRRLVAQGRLRDYDDLVTEVQTLAQPSPTGA